MTEAAPTPTATIVFVHGFISNADCWNPFIKRLQDDPRMAAYRLLCFTYPTEFIEWNPLKRIPDIKQCANALCEFLSTECPEGALFLVGHSMGGLVIQSYLADQISHDRGRDLARIRSVVLFATPNRGSTIASTLRSLFDGLRGNDQERDLKVLNGDVAGTSDIIVRSVLSAKVADGAQCPIPFRIFWGLQDDIVPEVSARGPFIEASALPGGHFDILRPDPKNPRDQRYISLKDAILNPIGHPSVYEIDRFEVTLAISPTSPEIPYTIPNVDLNEPIRTDNLALRQIDIAFSRQNRCTIPYEQMYRSEKGWIEQIGITGKNQASDEAVSEYFSTGKRFSYVFTPDRDDTYTVQLRIFNGFGAKQRSWHNHMKQNAHYRLFRLTLDLTAYRTTGYVLSPEPTFYFHTENSVDHDLCGKRVFNTPLPALASTPDPWRRTWVLSNLTGGVVDVLWDLQPPVASSV